MGSIGNGAAPSEDYTTPRQGYARKLAEFLLQEYFFIPLDIFRKRIENRSEKAIETELEAWLLFLSFDEPEWMIRLIIFDFFAYPLFFLHNSRNKSIIMLSYYKERNYAG